MNDKERFLEILRDPDALYLREGIAKFKNILFDNMFDYTAEYNRTYSNKPQYIITVRTDDQDALEDLDKDFVLCFSQVLHRAYIRPMQYSDTFERKFILSKSKDNG